jgi:membrane fusion protein (multidrug efflux system)
MSSTLHSARRLLLAGVAGLALSSCGPSAARNAGPDQGPAEVGVITVTPSPVTLTVELAGRTSAYLVAEVRPQVGGIVRSRLFEEGAMVREGQSLYQIDPATFQASLSSANAGLAQARANLTAAKLKADRYRELVEINAVSRQDNDDAQAAYQAAVAAVAAQSASVEQARISVDQSRVLAPISGRIGKSAVTPGALVTATQAIPLATIQRLDRIYVDVTQSASDMLDLRRRLAAGDLGATQARVKLTLEDGTTYPLPGTLEFSDVTVNQSTGSVGLRAVFPNPDGMLLPGMYVRATLATGVKPDGILVPQAAVSRAPNGDATVYVISDKNVPQVRVLTVEQTIGDSWLVSDGLRAGERVVVDGLQRIRPGGAPVKPVVVDSAVVTAAAAGPTSAQQ